MSLMDTPDERTRTAGLRALAHPLRLRILSLLTGVPMTAAEVARELDITHANASYHLRQLHAAGAIELAGEERIRGGRAKRYRYDADRSLATAAPATRAREGAADAGKDDQRLLFAALAVELRRRAERLIPGLGNLLTDAELWVDPHTLDDVRARLNSASVALHHAARPPRSPGTVRINATVALFWMEPDP
jgi:DNA-binding transcriptional ArsR family regulator